MTKTQQHLMEMLAKHGGFYDVYTCHGRGPQGGKTVTHGARERDAMFALQKRGLIMIVDQQTWSEARNGNTRTFNSFGFRLV